MIQGNITLEELNDQPRDTPTRIKLEEAQTHNGHLHPAGPMSPADRPEAHNWQVPAHLADNAEVEDPPTFALSSATEICSADEMEAAASPLEMNVLKSEPSMNAPEEESAGSVQEVDTPREEEDMRHRKGSSYTFKVVLGISAMLLFAQVLILSLRICICVSLPSASRAPRFPCSPSPPPSPSCYTAHFAHTAHTHIRLHCCFGTWLH